MSSRKRHKMRHTGRHSEYLKMKAAGIWDVLGDSVKNFQNNGDANQAAAISLYTILSAIPLIILTVIVAGNVLNSYPQILSYIQETIRDFNPYFSEKILAQLGQIEGKKHLLGSIGVLGLIWASAAIFNSMETALNITFRSRKKRNYFSSKLLAISMIPLGWLLGSASLIISFLAACLTAHPLQLTGGIVISLTTITGFLLRYIIPYIVTVISLYFLYWIIPTGKIRPSVLLSGSILSALLLEMAKQFFTWYIASYTRYSVIFGGLEPIVLLVVWVFYVALIFLFCAEIMSSYMRRNMLLLERAMLKPHKSYLKVDERLFKKFGRFYPKNSLIFSEGDAGHQMFYILSGRVALEKESFQAKRLLSEMSPGQYFGEMAALINAPRTASAHTLEDSHLAVIDDVTFSDLIRESHDVAIFMLTEFSYRLKHTDASLEAHTNLWIRLIVIIYFVENTHIKIDEHLEKLAHLTKKLVIEIQEVIDDLVRQEVIVVKEGYLIKVVKSNIWAIMEKLIGNES
jgi:membrane protein